MRTSAICVRWRLLTGFGCAAMLAATMAWSAPPEESKPDDAASESVSKPSDLPDDAVDLTDKVEVTVNGALRSSSRTAHSVSIAVKNISEDDLTGPIAIIVDATGIDALRLNVTDGKLSDGRPYVEIVKAGTELKAGRSVRAQKLTFKTDDSLTAQTRGQFDLQVRVCRVIAKEVAENEGEKIEGKKYTQKQFDQVIAVQEKWTLPLIDMGEGRVYGTAVSENAEGDLVVRVYTQRSGLDEVLPETVDGVPVQIKTIGSCFSMEHPRSPLLHDNGEIRTGAGGKVQGPAPVDATTDENGVVTPRFSGPGGDPTIRFTRPVPIGVSIANAGRLFDTDPFEPACYSGTLGCRCVDSLGTRYLLTNAHVGGGLIVPPEGDPVPIGFITGFPGETIVQPGTGDAGMCGFDLDDPLQVAALQTLIDDNAIGTLVDIESTITTLIGFVFPDDEGIVFAPINYMDASVVQIIPGSTSFDTPVGGYDTIQRTVYSSPKIGLPVKKYGRTTIYSEGECTGVNVAAIVFATGEDADGVGFYIKQYEFANLNGFAGFSFPGDSGSVIISDLPGQPQDRQPVALLFAGGGGTTLANPIGPILARFGLMVDDGTGEPSTAGISGTMGGAIAPVDPPSRLR